MNTLPPDCMNARRALGLGLMAVGHIADREGKGISEWKQAEKYIVVR